MNSTNHHDAERQCAFRGFVASLLLLALVVLVALSSAGCSPKREEIPVYHESSAVAAAISANLEARDKGGVTHLVLPTGSMEPTLHGGDIVVGVPTRFADLQVGMIVDYRPAWNAGKLTCHRLVARWPDGGFIAEGDGPKNTAETQSRVDASTYVDHVIAVHRFP